MICQDNNLNTGSWSGDALVSMKNNKLKRIDEIKAGDIIKTLGDINDPNSFEFTEVICVVETKLNPKINTKLCKFGDHGKISLWHPINIFKDGKSEWVFPYQILEIKEEKCESLFNFILKDNHVAIINGISCITLGHGYTNGILKHPYWGTYNVIYDLIKIPNFTNGHVIINQKFIKMRRSNFRSKL